MKAASAQTPFFLSADGLTIRPNWSGKTPSRHSGFLSDRPACSSHVLAEKHGDARWVGVTEVVSFCVLVTSLIFALGECLRQFAQF